MRIGRKLLMLDTSWQEYASCLGVDPDLFFPERGASTREAKEVCRGCVVQGSCLEFALANGEKFGIWGGESARGRRRIRRQRALDQQDNADGNTSTTPLLLVEVEGIQTAVDQDAVGGKLDALTELAGFVSEGVGKLAVVVHQMLPDRVSEMLAGIAQHIS